jgi:putative transposase
LVQARTYLVLCQRYIEFNPVRAGMIGDPADYPWSSYRAKALGEPNPLRRPHPIYLAFEAEPGQRYAAYRDLFGCALEDAPLAALRLALNQNQPAGNDRFYAEIEAVTGHRREPRKRGRPRKAPVEEPAPDLGQRELPL